MGALFEQILDELKGAWRFRWIGLAAAWSVCLIGWLAVLAMPDRYGARARVFVDTQTVLTQTVEGLTFRDNIAAQLNYVRQSLLGSPSLTRIARETDLDVRAHTAEQHAALIERLREQIQIDAAASGRDSSDIIFTLSYKDPSRDKALEVVTKLLNTFIEDTLGGKREGSEEAQQFLRRQIAEYEGRLREAEERLAEFKKANVGLVPGEQGDYFARLQGEMEASRVAREQLSIALSRRDELRRQLSGEQAFLPGGAGGATALGGGKNDTTTRILEARAKLDELLLRFTDRHPDVVALRETIAQLEERQKQEIEALRRGDPGAAAGSGLSSNPVYQQLQLQLRQAEVDVATLQRQIADREARIKDLRELLDTVPEVEANYARLNRDYDVTRAQYAQLVDRLEKARLSEQAQQTGTVRFEVIDPPSAPFDPVEPNRLRLIAMVFIAGLGIGAGIAYLLHQLKPVFSNVRTLAEVTGLTVLGAVSRTWLPLREEQRRKSVIAFGAAAATLVMAFALTISLQQPGSQLLRHLLS